MDSQSKLQFLTQEQQMSLMTFMETMNIDMDKAYHFMQMSEFDVEKAGSLFLGESMTTFPQFKPRPSSPPPPLPAPPVSKKSNYDIPKRNPDPKSSDKDYEEYNSFDQEAIINQIMQESQKESSINTSGQSSGSSTSVRKGPQKSFGDCCQQIVNYPILKFTDDSIKKKLNDLKGTGYEKLIALYILDPVKAISEQKKFLESQVLDNVLLDIQQIGMVSTNEQILWLRMAFQEIKLTLTPYLVIFDAKHQSVSVVIKLNIDQDFTVIKFEQAIREALSKRLSKKISSNSSAGSTSIPSIGKGNQEKKEESKYGSVSGPGLGVNGRNQSGVAPASSYGGVPISSSKVPGISNYNQVSSKDKLNANNIRKDQNNYRGVENERQFNSDYEQTVKGVNSYEPMSGSSQAPLPQPKRQVDSKYLEDQRIMQEQEFQYRKALEQKEREDKLQRQKQDDERKQIEDQKQCKQEGEKLKKRKRDNLPEEPAAGGNGVIQVDFRLPDGSKISRRFRMDDKLQLLYDFVDTRDDIQFSNGESPKYEISQPMGVANINQLRGQKFRDAFEDSHKQMLTIVQVD